MNKKPGRKIHVSQRRNISSCIVLLCAFTFSLFGLLHKTENTTLDHASLAEFATQNPISNNHELENPWGLLSNRSGKGEEPSYPESFTSGAAKALFANSVYRLVIWTSATFPYGASLLLPSSNKPRAPPLRT